MSPVKQSLLLNVCGFHATRRIFSLLVNENLWTQGKTELLRFCKVCKLDTFKQVQDKTRSSHSSHNCTGSICSHVFAFFLMILSSLFPAFLVVPAPGREDFIPDDKLASAPGMLYFPGNRGPVFAFLVTLSSLFPAFLIVSGPAGEDFIPDDKLASAPGMLHFPGNRRLTVRCPVQPAPSSSVVSGPLQSTASPSDLRSLSVHRQVTTSLFQCIAK